MQDKTINSKKKKVCYVVTKGVWGGAQKYVYSLATSLPSDQYETLVVCGQGGALQDKLEQRNIRTITLDKMKRDIDVSNEFSNFFSLIKLLRSERPDVLHLNSPKAGGLGALAGRIVGIKKIIYTTHGWVFNENRDAMSKAAIWFLSWITVLLSHKIIVLSKEEMGQALRMPAVSNNKIEFIRNGIEKINFLERDEARQKLSEIAGNNFDSSAWFGTIAELHENKGLKYSFFALKEITKPFVYFLIGDGVEKLNLQVLARDLGLHGKIVFLGQLENAAQYLKAFDIYLFPSIKEGMPYSILEAGQAGLPIIASSVGAIAEIIEDRTDGIVFHKTDVTAISVGINYLLDNPEKQKEFGEKLKSKIEKEFSLETMVKTTFDLY